MKGEVVYLYAFDVANEIQLGRVTRILGQTPTPFEIKMERAFPRDVPLCRPLSVNPDLPTATMQGRPIRVTVRVYEVGVVAIAARWPFEVERLAELHPQHHPRMDDGRTLERLACALNDQICESLRDFMIRSSPPPEPEAYTVFSLTQIEGVTDVNCWLADRRREVAGLLTETPAASLSDAQVAEAHRLQRSYTNADVVVIDWEAALIVDVDGYVDDVLYVLELANLQLEEFRVMDRTLDQYLDQAYQDLDNRGFALFGTGAATLRRLRRFRVDLTKLADEVTHITKFFGDWHLARVYVAAHERFYLEQWRRSVESRLAQLDQLYQVAHSDVNERRMLWLEAIIVILFIIDLAALFWLK